MRGGTDRRHTRGTIEHMSNGNIITTTLAVIGGARLTLHAAGAVERAYLTRRIGTEYTTWRTNQRNNRDRRTFRDARSLAALCERHGLTGTARFYHWLVDTAQKLDPDAEKPDMDLTLGDMQRTSGRVNRDRL